MTGREDGQWKLDLGATWLGSSTAQFRVWAPHVERVAVRLKGGSLQPLAPEGSGYFQATVAGVNPGDRYLYLLNGNKERPDPASRFQPHGVHGPSAVVDPESFQWTDDDWCGMPLTEFIIYELHVGAFTQEGTFQALIPYLKYLQEEVGVTAIELMPVAQFPGRRNWGYDGVYPYAPQASYGGPDGLKALVNACHAAGLAIVLDVVYNHPGPEGNYLGDFGPYFTDRYRTPWGDAMNYDGPDSDAVRHFVISNALYWVTEYHVDALRLDAIHRIYDFSATHILRELTAAVHDQAERLGRRIFVIAESALNDARVIAPPAQGGYGLDGQWNDDFHHALRTTLTEERAGYYQDFDGLRDLVTALQDGYVSAGQSSRYRRRRHGNSSKDRSPSQFVVFSENHDQVGNRALGDRLSVRISFEALKVAAAAVLLSPNIPLLFMGEEYGETAPFQYFIDHSDPALIEAVRRGRREEFARFGSPRDIPDPQDPATFDRSRIGLEYRTDQHGVEMIRWTKALIDLRKSVRTLGGAESDEHGHRVWAYEAEQILVMHRWHRGKPSVLLVLGFNKTATSFTLRQPAGRWRLLLHSLSDDFGGGHGDRPQSELTITRIGEALRFSPYAAAIFLASP